MEKRRPTKKEQKEIKNKIINLYSLGYSPSYIIEKTGYDKKTVYKYINEVIDNISQDKDALKNTKLAINQAILSFDKLIEMNLNLITQADKEIKNENAKTAPFVRPLLALKSNLIKSHVDILDKKTSYQIRVASDGLIESFSEIIS